MKVDVDIDPGCFNAVYLDHLLWNNHRYQIVYGGASSGKSFAIAQRTVLDVFNGNRNYLIVRNVAKTLRQSCFNEIVKAIGNFKLTSHFTINKSDLVITCNVNRRQILFAGLDDPEKIKSITPIFGVITDIWVEEATECDRAAIKQLDKRLRGRASVTKRLTLSFNPILRTHWIVTEYFLRVVSSLDDFTSKEPGEGPKYFEDGIYSLLKTTYADNEFLEPDDIEALERETDSYYYQVYTLGNWGILGHVIYTNWRTEDLSEMRKTFDLFRHGVDWGFGSDPFAYGKLYYDKNHKRLYICDEVTGLQLSNADAAELIKPFCGRDVVTCDSSEPKSITEFQTLGIGATAAKKGPGSIEHGIKFLQSLEIIVDQRCQTAINELSTYKYKEDTMGNALPIPLDKNNHVMDLLRYATEEIYLMRADGKPEDPRDPESRSERDIKKHADHFKFLNQPVISH